MGTAALFDLTGKPYPPPDSYPHFFYGFLSVAMAWQFAFFAIASNPARFRLIMIPAIVEKLGYIVSNPRVAQSVRQRRPFLLAYPGCAASSCLRAIADRLTRKDPLAPVSERPSFVRRLPESQNMWCPPANDVTGEDAGNGWFVRHAATAPIRKASVRFVAVRTASRIRPTTGAAGRASILAWTKGNSVV